MLSLWTCRWRALRSRAGIASLPAMSSVGGRYAEARPECPSDHRGRLVRWCHERPPFARSRPDRIPTGLVRADAGWFARSGSLSSACVASDPSCLCCPPAQPSSLWGRGRLLRTRRAMEHKPRDASRQSSSHTSESRGAFLYRPIGAGIQRILKAAVKGCSDADVKGRQATGGLVQRADRGSERDRNRHGFGPSPF
jgi:hypothetical protein